MKQTKASILYFMGPAMLLFCLIFIYPVSRTAIMSFFSVKSVTSAASTWSWAGLDNYIKLFHTPLFITSVINIGKIWLYCGIACYNGVGSEKLTASELYRCPNLSYNEDVLRERSIA